MTPARRTTVALSRAWAAVRDRAARGGTDAGNITLLAIAFGMLALLLVTAVVSATSVHLERKRLLVLADELALEAADALDLASFYRGGAAPPTQDGVVPLTDADVRRAVEEYLTEHDALLAGREGLVVTEAVADDGRTARVGLAALARPPLISWITAPWSDGVVVRATSSARAW
ncbi:pilus assembly protein TadG-related protein [uncultured Cellulomonas sp.]|uniref:pilus assembly protein TadG-related protein n=1 Tax=uncultured Cellulomonas sp. TaxID=189682 RepID=UPI00261B7116|nr:pilus assembly protein TadG-related protein [uncultured Cellulomonas sp.]